MCGIAGGWERNPSAAFEPRLHASLDQIRHRGPDDRGAVMSDHGDRGVVRIGSTRLAVLDLSSAGHMPMVSDDGRFVLAYNGEVTNYLELRRELIDLGHVFRSGTDTEVLLAAWREWGRASLGRFEGMFAFAILDKQAETLTLVRDAFGIKPLYFTVEDGRHLYYGSEVPALMTVMPTAPRLDWQTAHDYVRWGVYDGGVATFVEGIRQLLPAHLVELDLRSGRVGPQTRYWWPEIETDESITFTEAVDGVRQLFLDSVSRNLRSDVPVGVALSGGVDSSAIACSIRRLEPDYPIRTFSFVSPGFAQSEHEWIDLVNGAISAQPHHVQPAKTDLGDDLDDLIRTQGEPFRSTSIYAQYRVFRLAREHGVVVTLDGQGADELLAGYDGYPVQRLHSLLDRGRLAAASSFARSWSASVDGASAPALLAAAAARTVPSGIRSIAGRMSRTGSPILDQDALTKHGVRVDFPRIDERAVRGMRVKSQLRNDLLLRGLGSLLRHGDRNSMRFSVESRVPFLDRALTEFTFRLPERFFVTDDGVTKNLLRSAMRGVVPDAVLDRRDKIGFVTPEAEWLQELSGDELNSANIGFLDATASRDWHTMSEAALGLGAGGQWRLLNLARWVRVFDVDAR